MFIAAHLVLFHGSFQRLVMLEAHKLKEGGVHRFRVDSRHELHPVVLHEMALKLPQRFSAQVALPVLVTVIRAFISIEPGSYLVDLPRLFWHQLRDLLVAD